MLQEFLSPWGRSGRVSNNMKNGTHLHPVIFCSWPVSRILSRFMHLRETIEPVSIIYLVPPLLAGSYDLPPGIGRAILNVGIHGLSPIRCTAPGVTIRTGELLPRLFTLTPFDYAQGRLFSVTLLYPHGYLPVRKHGALCCPDFPSRVPGTMERPAVLQRY